jgi:hypothetical protein
MVYAAHRAGERHHTTVSGRRHRGDDFIEAKRMFSDTERSGSARYRRN